MAQGRATLQEFFDDECSIDKKSQFKGLNQSFVYYEFRSKQPCAYFQGKGIIKIRIFRGRLKEKDKEASICLSFIDHTKIFMVLAPGKTSDLIDIIYSLPKDEDCTLLSNPAYSIGGCSVLPWKEKGILPIYKESKNCDEDYKNLGGILLGQLASILKSHPEATIIDIGCGDGRFLKRLFKAGLTFEDKSIKCQLNLFGIDFSPINIENAKKDCGNINFILDDIFNIFNIIEKHKIKKDKPIVIVASGLFSRCVFPNGFYVARFLQKLILLPNLINIIGGAKTILILNRHKLKRIGFNSKEIVTLHDNLQPFNLFPFTDQEILNNKIKKLKTVSVLDLSFSPRAEEWLRHGEIVELLKEQKQTITIDLSYCDMTDALQEQILLLDQKYQISWIFYHFDEENLDKMSLLSILNHLNIIIKKSNSDSVLMGAMRFNELAFHGDETVNYKSAVSAEVFDEIINQYHSSSKLLSYFFNPYRSDVIRNLRKITSFNVVLVSMNNCAEAAMSAELAKRYRGYQDHPLLIRCNNKMYLYTYEKKEFTEIPVPSSLIKQLPFSKDGPIDYKSEQFPPGLSKWFSDNKKSFFSKKIITKKEIENAISINTAKLNIFQGNTEKLNNNTSHVVKGLRSCFYFGKN